MSRKSGRTFALWTLGLGALAVAAAVPLYLAGYRYNETPSLPRGVWRLIPPTFERGEIVAFCPDPETPAIRIALDRGYIREGACPGGIEPMFKPIVGIAGDTVEIDAAGVRVAGTRLPASSRPHAVDGTGAAMPAQPRRQVIPPSTLFVVSTYSPWSYDSRYFGPIHRSQVTGAAHPVWLIEATAHD